MKPYHQDGSATVYRGEAAQVLAALPTGAADVLLTDPPYSSGGMFRGDRAADPAAKYRGWSQNPDGSSCPPKAEYGSFGGDTRDQRGWMLWVLTWATQAMRVVRPGGHAFVFSDWRQLPAATDALQLGGWSWRGILVWDKGVARPMAGRFRNHLEFVVWGSHGAPAPGSTEYPSALIHVPTVPPGTRQHVTQKPTALLEHLLRVVPRQAEPLVVLDPFMGSGSTLRAAKDAGHRSIGVDLEERYCQMAVERLARSARKGWGVNPLGAK